MARDWALQHRQVLGLMAQQAGGWGCCLAAPHLEEEAGGRLGAGLGWAVGWGLGCAACACEAWGWPE